jgi:CheY-like chemotaxis protein
MRPGAKTDSRTVAVPPSTPPTDGDDDKSSILVVDDRPDKLLALRTILEELNQNIVVAESGEEALKRVLEHEFAVILLDVNMPGMDGLETAAYIRKRPRTAHTPIIFVTAYADEMHTAQGYSLGAVDYILAPVVPDILRTKVKVFVQLHRMTRQIQRQAAERVALAQEQAARAAAEESTGRFRFLVDLSDLLDQSLDLHARVQALVRFVVPQLGDFAALVLLNERGRVVRTEMAYLQPQSGLHSVSAERLMDTRFAHAVQQALTGKAEISEEPGGARSCLSVKPLDERGADVLELGFPLLSLAGFPLRARGRTQGVLLLALREGRRFDSTAWSFANAAATRAAVMIDNALLYDKICEADARKNEFLAMLAHELRNPMAPIRNAVAILRAPDLNSSQRGWGLDVIERQVHQLVRLVDDLLDVSRITSGKIQLKLQPVRIAEVVAAAVETSRPLIESLRHELRLEISVEPLVVSGDFARLTQVFANLLNNAAKYTEPGGRIVLTLARSADEAVVRVTDTGIGIRPESLASIFELFAQADRTLDRAQGGLGVGLTLVQRLVELHGGSVLATSAGAGQGAEFTVSLPLRATIQDPQAEPGARAHDTAAVGCRILVVDDNVDSAQTLATLLRMEGHQTEVAYDGPSALAQVQKMDPDVIFLDIGLPGMSGFQVARELRARPQPRGVALIAVTGYGQPADRQHALDAGFDHHLVKPVDLNVVRELLERLRRETGAGDLLNHDPLD